MTDKYSRQRYEADASHRDRRAEQQRQNQKTTVTSTRGRKH